MVPPNIPANPNFLSKTVPTSGPNKKPKLNIERRSVFAKTAFLLEADTLILSRADA